MSCGVGHRRGLDLTLLWLWRRPEAVAPIRPLAWEHPCAMGAALKRKRQKKNLRKQNLFHPWLLESVDAKRGICRENHKRGWDSP